MNKILLFFVFVSQIGLSLFSQTYYKPVTLFSFDNVIGNNLILESVVINESYTKLVITYTNTKYEEGWISINNNSYLVDLKTKKNYKLKKTENISISPNKTNMNINESKTFNLFFEKIPETCRQFHFIENEIAPNYFKILNICLDKKQIDYTPNIEELKKYMPEIILTYFSDGTSSPKFEEVFNVLKEQSLSDSRMKNFKISEKIYDKENKLDLITYSFEYNEVKIFLEKNTTYDKNRMIYIQFGSEYSLNRVINCFTKVFQIKKESGGYYTFPDRVIDMISIIDGKIIGYLSVN